MAQELSFNRRAKHLSSKYICGVVEGFYGRPWTLDQRKHLYGKINRLGLNTYLYAPKDDIKHRQAWREPYTDEESVILRNLIESAKNNHVNFVYALSPGLDITYSCPQELATLRRKMEQVVSIGCDSFALLFDDIEVVMHEKDQQVFKSFADAQVYITNTIFDNIKTKNFFFCPTEYCETRANPNLEQSQYLNTIGLNLREPIHILWTGPQVISRYFTVEHLKRVQSVFRRKPLIWDNLHANDYDQKRVFLGPYKGRSVIIKQFTSGLLLNPNCKYEANFIPFYTVSDWNASDKDATYPLTTENDVQLPNPTVHNTSFMNIDCNTETEYNYELSGKNAISTWIHDFCAPSGPNIPQTPRLELNTTVPDFVLERQNIDTPSEKENVLNADARGSELNSLTADYAQPMEEDEPPSDANSTELEMESVNEYQSTSIELKAPDFETVASFVDLYYLPFEGGPGLRKLFEDYAYLLENVSVMNKKHQEIETLDPLQTEWIIRYDQIVDYLIKIGDVFHHISESSNKALVTELIPYAWEAHGASVILLAVARWMLLGQVDEINCQIEKFWSYQIEEEPWNWQGGFINECICLLSRTDNVAKLFYSKIVLPLSIYTYEIRPFFFRDEEFISELSLLTTTKDEDILRLRARVFSDKIFKPFLMAGAKYNFVAEEIAGKTRKPMCFASAHSNGLAVRDFLIHYKEHLRNQYSQDVIVENFDMSEIIREVDKWFPSVPSDVFANYPAWVSPHFAYDAYDAVPMRKILLTIAVTLSMNGCQGMFVTIPIDENERQQYFLRLGFNNLGHSECNNYVLLGHELGNFAGRTTE